MLLTTHHMEEADRLCTRLAIIDDGRVVVEGRPDALKAGVGADTVVVHLGPAGRGATPSSGVRTSAAGEDTHRGDGSGRDARKAEFCRLLEGMVDCAAVAADDGSVTLSVPDAAVAVPALLRRLDGNGLDVTALHMSQPSLDDVFLK